MRMSTITLGSLSLVISLGVAAPAWSQNRVGVVTTVIGAVTVARASAPAEPLKFKDDIFLRDRVTTGEAAMTRILMGGKVVVTARERSTLTITEVPGLSTIDLTSGRIAVAVDKTRMKSGERVDVRTPNAIAGVRGTVLIVEAQRGTSSVTVLRGLVDVVRLDPATGRSVGPVTPVGARQTVTVRNDVLPPRAQSITPDRGRQLSQEFTPPIRTVEATSVMPVKDEVTRATALVNQLLPTPDRAAATSTGATAKAPVDGRAPASTATSSTSAASSTVSRTTTAVMSSTPLATPTTTSLPSTTTLPTTSLPSTTATALPTRTTVPNTTSLVQPVVQPVVQNVVQPVVQTVTQPVTNLLR